MKYGALLIDPPWHFITRGRITEHGHHASRHYKTMKVDEIAALHVQDYAADDCVLFLWTIDTHIPRALHIINQWGFTFKTVAFTWVKTNAKSPGYFTGMGFWTRANTETCLLATKGSPKRVARDVRRLIVAPRREHSRKPDEVYGRIEALVKGPFIEFFARQRRPGWDVAFSDEEDKFCPIKESATSDILDTSSDTTVFAM